MSEHLVRYVIAGNHAQAVDYMRRNGFTPKDTRIINTVRDAESLPHASRHGDTQYVVLHIGTWYDHPHIEWIDQVLALRGLL